MNSNSLVQDLSLNSLVPLFLECLELPTEALVLEDLFKEEYLKRLLQRALPSSDFQWDIEARLFKDDLQKVALLASRAFLEVVRAFHENALEHEVLQVPDLEAMLAQPEEHVQDLELLLLLFFGCALHGGEDWFFAKVATLEWDLFVVFLEQDLGRIQNVVRNKRSRRKGMGQFREMLVSSIGGVGLAAERVSTVGDESLGPFEVILGKRWLNLG